MQLENGGLVTARPEWLASPLKEQLFAGAAANLQRSQFVEKRADGASAAAAVAVEPDAGEAATAAAAAIAACEVEPPVFDEDDADVRELFSTEENANCSASLLVDDNDEDSMPPIGKRQRTTRTAVEPQVAVPKAKARSSKGSRKSQSREDAAPTAKLNKRTGRAYVRGPYKSSPPLINSASDQAPRQSDTTLQQELKASKQHIKELQEQLEREKQSVIDKVEVAKQRTTALMRLELQQQYMLGLSHGSTLARGEAISLPSVTPSSACSI